MARVETNKNSDSLGFAAELFKAADKLRGNMKPSDYKHVALSLIFLKYISDAFEAMPVLVRRILRRYGYPPDLQDKAVQLVLQQAEALSSKWILPTNNIKPHQ